MDSRILLQPHPVAREKEIISERMLRLVIYV